MAEEENSARFAWLKTLPIFTWLHRTNLCRMQAAKEMPQTNTHTRTHRHTHTGIHTLGAHLTQFICRKLRVMFLISAAGSGFSPLPSHKHTESKKINELSLSKSSDLIRQKKDYTFFGGKDLRAAKWISLAASNANNCDEYTPSATPSQQLVPPYTHT